MAKDLGPTFGDEIIAAGLGGLPFSWGATDETILGRENLTTEQNTTLDGVVEAHDPAKQVEPQPKPGEEALYDHENRIRALEGTPPMTMQEFLRRSSRAK